jgi:hypothetical protein
MGRFIGLYEILILTFHRNIIKCYSEYIDLLIEHHIFSVEIEYRFKWSACVRAERIINDSFYLNTQQMATLSFRRYQTSLYILGYGISVKKR